MAADPLGRSGDRLNIVMTFSLDHTDEPDRATPEEIEAVRNIDWPEDLIGPFNNIEDLFTALDSDDDGG